MSLPITRSAASKAGLSRQQAGSSSDASTSPHAASASPKAPSSRYRIRLQIRKTFGKPICEHQAIQLKLGEMATRARAARLLTLDAARAFDNGERCDMEAGMAKYFASEAALREFHRRHAHPRRFMVIHANSTSSVCIATRR